MNSRIAVVISVLVLSTAVCADVALRGRVLCEGAGPLAGVRASLVRAGLRDTTGDDGVYRIVGTSASAARPPSHAYTGVSMDGSTLRLCLSAPGCLHVRLYDLHGRLVRRLDNRRARSGVHHVALGAMPVARGHYLVETRIGTRRYRHRYSHIRHRAGAVMDVAEVGAGRHRPLAKSRDAVVDTLELALDGEVVTSVPVTVYVDSLADVVLVRRDVYGDFTGANFFTPTLGAAVSGPSGVPRDAALVEEIDGWTYMAALYFEESAGDQDYSVVVAARDSLGRMTGHSEAVTFTTGSGDIVIPTFDATNVCPTADAGPDTFVLVNETFGLAARATVADGHAISGYRWKIDDGPWWESDGDTVLTAPATPDTLVCSLAVIDDAGLTAYDYRTVRVKTAPVEPDEIVLLYPLGGETFNRGDEIRIRWVAGEEARDHGMELWYSTDGRMLWEYVVPDLYDQEGVAGEYAWTVPAIASSSCHIKVAAYGHSATYYDVSEAFEIR